MTCGSCERGFEVAAVGLEQAGEQPVRAPIFEPVLGPVAVLDACAVKDRRPKAAIGVRVTQQYMHCAKAFRRGELWNPQTWPDRSTLPSLGCIARDQIATLREVPPEVIDKSLEADYATSLWD